MSEATIDKTKAIKDLAARLDLKINQMQGYQSNQLTEWLESLLSGKRVEVGWRSSCGHTDATHKIFREWVKVLKALRKSGYRLNEESVKHGNAYATNKGGFWNSNIYSIAQ